MIHNARIYVSGEDDYTWLIFDQESGYIVNIGRDPPRLDDFDPEQRQDCGGRRILPGLQESHIHVSSVGEHMSALQLQGCSSIEEFQNAIKERPQTIRGQEAWITAFGWEQGRLGRYPTVDDVDKICGDRALLALRVCAHIAIVNSRALKLAGKLCSNLLF